MTDQHDTMEPVDPVIDQETLLADSDTVQETDGNQASDAAESGEAEKPKASGYQKRINQLTAQKHQEALERQRVEEERDYWRQMATQGRAIADYGQQQPENRGPLEVDPGQIVDQVKQTLAFENRRDALMSKVEPDVADFLSDQYSPISPVMAEIMLSADNGADIARWFTENQTEAARIAGLSSEKQAVAIYNAARQIKASPSPTTRPASSAPAPAPRLSGGARPEKNPESMSMDDFVKWRSNQIGS